MPGKPKFFYSHPTNLKMNTPSQKFQNLRYPETVLFTLNRDRARQYS